MAAIFPSNAKGADAPCSLSLARTRHEHAFQQRDFSGNANIEHPSTLHQGKTCESANHQR
jgi:hypothetical protein